MVPETELSSRLLQKVMETTPDGIILLDRDGQIYFVNRRAEEILCTPGMEIIKRQFNDRSWKMTDLSGAPLPDERLPFMIVKNTLQSVYDTQLSVEFSNGNRAILSINAAPLLNDSGEFNGIILTVLDITDVKLSEQERRQQREFLEIIFNSLYMHIAYLDSEFRFIRVNDAFAAAAGKASDYFPGKNHFDLYPYPENQAIFQHVLDTCKPYMVKAKPFVHPGPERGTTYWDWSLMPVSIVNGRAGGLLLTLQDVTEYKNVELALIEAAQEIEDLYDRAPCGYHSLDRDGLFVRTNQTELDWLGYRREEVVGKLRFPDLLTPGSLKTFNQNFPKFKATGSIADLEFDLYRKDGTVLPVILSATAIYDNDGSFLMSRSIVYDNTDRKRIERELLESELRFRNAFEHAPVGMAILSPEGAFIQVNDALCRIFDYSKDELLGKTTRNITHPDDIDADLEQLQRLTEHPEIPFYEIDKRYICRGGDTIWVHLTVSILRDEQGRPREIVKHIQDISELKNYQLKLEQQARTDSLTGVSNRRHFMELAEQEFIQAKRYEKPLSVFMLDLDHFKSVNDNYGHHIGDLVLQKVCEVSRRALREADVIGRLGGEEFSVILPETDIDRAVEVAERLRQAVAVARVNLNGDKAVSCTISIGVATRSNRDASINQMINRADSAMYEAKRDGRNRVKNAED